MLYKINLPLLNLLPEEKDFEGVWSIKGVLYKFERIQSFKIFYIYLYIYMYKGSYDDFWKKVLGTYGLGKAFDFLVKSILNLESLV